MKHFMNIHTTKTVVRRQRASIPPFQCTRPTSDGCAIVGCLSVLSSRNCLMERCYTSMFVNWFMKPVILAYSA